ncbi:hypothetical protein BYT27DRAFT_7249356 [Phlegmacium glaucopus]|nr:hypothetical protein BYT27DRAFT_7249356 [Phlegmacium glaucopus]
MKYPAITALTASLVFLSLFVSNLYHAPIFILERYYRAPSRRWKTNLRKRKIMLLNLRDQVPRPSADITVHQIVHLMMWTGILRRYTFKASGRIKLTYRLTSRALPTSRFICGYPFSSSDRTASDSHIGNSNSVNRAPRACTERTRENNHSEDCGVCLL